MDNIFQYVFMQRAFVVAAIIAVIAPCIGVSIVLKRLSAIGDATSHSALAGIAFGQGRVIVSFTVKKDGSIADTKVERSVNEHG